MKTFLQIILQKSTRLREAKNNIQRDKLLQCVKTVWNVQLNTSEYNIQTLSGGNSTSEKERDTIDSSVQYLTQVKTECYTNVQKLSNYRFCTR